MSRVRSFEIVIFEQGVVDVSVYGRGVACVGLDRVQRFWGLPKRRVQHFFIRLGVRIGIVGAGTQHHGCENRES